jgi:hypothetical protein
MSHDQMATAKIGVRTMSGIAAPGKLRRLLMTLMPATTNSEMIAKL